MHAMSCTHFPMEYFSHVEVLYAVSNIRIHAKLKLNSEYLTSRYVFFCHNDLVDDVINDSMGLWDYG